MAKFEDPLQEELEFDEVEEEQKPEEQVEEPAVEEQPEPEIPDKYRNKSIHDIVKMHQEAERLIGKQAQEVGEVRRLADELLKRELSQQKAVQNPKQEEKDPTAKYFDDPVGAVNEAVANHPAIKEAQQQAFTYKQQQVEQKLRKEFPNFDEVIQDPQFFEWIKVSPVRTRLFTEAHSQYDYDSAVELVSTWNIMNKEKQVTQPNMVTESKKETAKNLKAATVDTGSPAPSSKKTYRRSDLINLRLRDPDRYYAMQDEIMSAYAEGRVK